MFKSGNIKETGEAQALVAKLEEFYERAEKQKQEGTSGGDNEFAIENLYGKRSAKETQFLQKMELFNKTDQQQRETLDQLISRWNNGVGKKKGHSKSARLKSMMNQKSNDEQENKRKLFIDMSKRQNKVVFQDGENQEEQASPSKLKSKRASIDIEIE